jgi:quercetin dioxygenase-like cupin family protein
LVKSMAAGDASALYDLYERMQRPVYGLASRIVPDQRTAEEVTLEVFREVWCRALSYDPAEETVVGWIMNQARAKAIERLRVPELPAPQPWAEPDWENVAPGISCRILSSDTDLQRVSMLVRLAPGGEYPPHRHAGIEELHLLEGELWIDDRKLYPGAYNRAEAGTTDSRVFSDTGCMCVLVTSTADELRGERVTSQESSDTRAIKTTK